MRQVGEAVAGFLVFFGLLAVLGGGIYLLRGLIEHRRWLQATKIQSDAHTRIVDRLSSNEELLAYLQSSTAQRFLAVAPLAADASHAPSAPIGRILWSMQSGIVVALGGAGLWIASSRVSFEEVSQPLQIVATVAIAVGLGFIVSAAASFGLSRRLGLISVDSTHG